MARVYENTKNYHPIKLAAFDEYGEILALLQAVVMNEGKGLAGVLTSRSVIHGGPLFINNKNGSEALRLLLEQYNRLVSKKAIFSEIRNSYDTNEHGKIFENTGYSLNDHLNYIFSLDSEEKVWSGIHRSMRRNINKSRKIGLTVFEATKKDEIEIFYDFLSDVLSQARVPIPHISLYKSMFDILVKNNMAKFHLCKYNENYIGGRVTLFYKETMYAYSVGVPARYKKLNANAFLNWYIITFGLQNGYKKLDFGGAGKPNLKYGVRDFKAQFGGDLVNYGRYKIVHSTLKNNIAEFGLTVYKNLPGWMYTK